MIYSAMKCQLFCCCRSVFFKKKQSGCIHNFFRRNSCWIFCIRKKKVADNQWFHHSICSGLHRCRENGVMIPLVSFWEVATLKVQIHSEVSEKGT